MYCQGANKCYAHDIVGFLLAYFWQQMLLEKNIAAFKMWYFMYSIVEENCLQFFFYMRKRKLKRT